MQNDEWFDGAHRRCRVQNEEVDIGDFGVMGADDWSGETPALLRLR